ncbi:beta-N-acetylhexosaminidase [Novosphingobium terrae]|uniref:beta-N-acetylhexosaminidase n=1 Tax=Novosphingobium terrae TaxID=2726189 RepID=UPI0019819637|nr:family 20 glycosylhydrolase [Novosphingobium terrae]
MKALHVLSLALAATISAPAMASSLPPLIPMPAKITPQPGTLTIANNAAITLPEGDKGARIAASLLIEKVAKDRGLTLSTGTKGVIHITRDASLPGDEAYRLEVSAKGVTLAAKGDAGLVYAAMTLAQLLSPDAHVGAPVRLSAMQIADAPRFKWRGVMLDTARHFLPTSAIYATIDQMAAHKLNTLHLHLTDDQGWRIEIKRYPDLTRIGAWRTPPSAGGAPGEKVGGFYTQDELKALVAYAAQRGITIVPEIDLPGHAQAAVAAYPEIGVLGARPDVSHDWGINPYLFNVNDHSVGFIKNVLDELMAIFPSQYIHLGGDEAIKDQWQRSPEVQAKMKALGITSENAMQSWLIDQLGTYLAQHGRRLIGWDEILEGGLPPSASVMSWRGDKGAVDAANQNHDVVLAPAPTLYMDSVQSRRADESAGRLFTVTLADLYNYDPFPKGLPADKAGHILGAEITAFSEYLTTPRAVQHVLFPRLDALSEVVWSAPAQHDWQGFLTRLQPQRLRYTREGINDADSAFAVDFALQGPRSQLLTRKEGTVAIATQTGFGQIRYTTDGREPTARSPLYKQPVAVKLGQVLKAAAFDGTLPTAQSRSFDLSTTSLLRWNNPDLVACPKGALGHRVPLTSEAPDGSPVFNVNLFDDCIMAPAVPTDAPRKFTVDVARLARHYGLAYEATKQIWHYSTSPHGELVMRVGGCEGDIPGGGPKGQVIATFPLPDPATAPNRFQLTGTVPAGTGDQNVCMLFTAPISGAFYTVASLQLEPAS